MPRQAGSCRSCRTLCVHVVQSKVTCRSLRARARRRSGRIAASVAARVHRLCGQAAPVLRLVQARVLRLVALMASNRSVVYRGRASSYRHARRVALAAPRRSCRVAPRGRPSVRSGWLSPWGRLRRAEAVPSGFGLRITPPSSGQPSAAAHVER